MSEEREERELPVGSPNEGDYRLMATDGEGVYTPFAFRSFGAALYYLGVAQMALDLTGKDPDQIVMRRYQGGQWVDASDEIKGPIEQHMYDIRETL